MRSNLVLRCNPDSSVDSFVYEAGQVGGRQDGGWTRGAGRQRGACRGSMDAGAAYHAAPRCGRGMDDRAPFEPTPTRVARRVAHEDRHPLERIPAPCTAHARARAPSPAFSCTDSTEQDAFGMAACSMPANQLEIMLEELRKTWPHLAQRERVVCTRVCWYSDTLDENWIIDSLANHPARPKGTDKGVGRQRR
ncbi:hypothetical protein L1887_57819 [Cichorium endivia]|nr:hypothetical protein L1887_57819 [Cichorium endivia]